MDKLQPLIKHRYWICFGLSLVFVLAGWWMASGAIAVEILARKDAVEKSFEKAKQGANDPNQFWVEAAKKENTKDDAAYKSASAQLLQRQKDARRWPDVLANDLKGIPYREDVKDSTTRGRWASIYRDEIEKLLTIVKPFKNGEGLVIVDTSKITHKPFNSWRTAYPSSTEIWDAQEDIWLLQSLLTSIARVNEGATRISEAQVRQISRLHLRGGDRDATPAAAGGGMMGGMGGDMGGMSMSAEMMGGAGAMGGGMGMGAAGGDGGKSHPGKEFEGSAGADILTEEFGPAGPAGGGASPMGMGGGMGMGMGMDAMSMGGAGGMGGAATPVEEVRYVDDGAELGYKTRAFLLDVVVRDDQLPNLLASLTNSDFPVEIVRVEVVSRSAPRGSGGGMPGGGMPGMDGGMMSSMGSAGGGDMADMGGGAGYGMPDDLGGGAGFGSGAELPDAGVGPGIYGSGSGGYDGGAGYPGMMPGAPGAGAGLAQNKGKEALQVAMADPLLVMVKIGGLMTLYQSAQEAESQAATAETDQASAPEPAAPGELVPDETADPNMTDAAGTPEGGIPTEGAPPGAETGAVASEGSPVGTEGSPSTPGSEPAVGTDPVGESPAAEAPGSTPPAPPNPEEGDPAAPTPGSEPTPEPSADTTGN